MGFRWIRLQSRSVLPLILVLVFSAAGLAAFFSVLPASGAEPPPEPSQTYLVNIERLHPALLKTLSIESEEAAFPILVEYARSPDLLAGLDLPSDRTAARRLVVDLLQQESARSASPILDVVRDGGGVDARAFWIAPVIRLEASPALIARLAAQPEVLQIRPDAAMSLREEPPDFQPEGGSLLPGDGELLWNLAAIRVDLAGASFGLDGSGVVVANLDTGVDWSHPALNTSYRGYVPGGPAEHYGSWHVSTGEAYPEPGDGYGHGTHTMGTLVGDDGAGGRIGVSPGARWIAVKMIDDSGVFLESWTHDALEWILAPEGDPALAPDIVSNSWSTGFGGDARFQPDIQALRAGGILPVFSAGNTGPWGGTINSPADYPESLAAGAVDDIAWVTSFSSRGPSPAPWNEIKPEIAAPGIDVLSSVPGGYALQDGTSMAAPHVAGVAALLLQADPSLGPSDLENIMKSSAMPLGVTVPNNQTGWGQLDAFAAGLVVSPHGQFSGTISIPGGPPVPGAVIEAVSQDPGHQFQLPAGPDGSYSITTLPGTYTLTASAFGFIPLALGGLEIVTGSSQLIDFSLQPVQGGWLTGTVLDALSGAPLSGTVEMLNGPLSVPTGSQGDFRLDLPPGTWVLRAEADFHRSRTFTVTTAAGITTSVHLELQPAPGILLVDSGRWYYGSKASYFQGALDSLMYPYDLWEIRDPFGQYSGVSDSPVITDLLPYDLVIWTAPADSPGLLRVDDEIESYLAEGGRFLVSGQDVAYWDGGSNPIVLPTYFPDYLGILYRPQYTIGDLSGVAGSPFEGLNLVLNAPDSGQEQYTPDSVDIQDPLLAQPVLVWPDSQAASVLAGGCLPYRAAWTGFGLEGVGPGSQRIEAFDRYLEWFQQPKVEFALSMESAAEELIGAPGETISRTVQVHNTGTQTDTYTITLNLGDWPAALILPGGGSEPFLLSIPGCSGEVVTATVQVPLDLPRDQYDHLRIGVVSAAQPNISQVLTLTMKTPAPLLLVEDGRWQFYGTRYAEVFENRTLSFDRLDTSSQDLAPAGLLKRYPLVVWTTGQDWFLPLPQIEQQMLIEYLDSGGRLLLSSQDLLDVAGQKPLARDYFGVAAYSLQVTPTLAASAPGSFMDGGGEAWALSYPFVNWSDAVRPYAGVQQVMLDSGLNVIGIGNAQAAWRSLFYSFPLETLSPAALESVLLDSLLWLGPLGGSRIELPRTVSGGAPLPVGLRLVSAEQETQEGLSVILALPAVTSLITGSLSGPWQYDTSTHSLIWLGDLPEGQSFSMTADLSVNLPLSGPTPLDFTADFTAGDSQVFRDSARVWVDAPELDLEAAVTPDRLYPPGIGLGAAAVQTATFSVTAQNTGWMTAEVRLTDTLPARLRLVTPSLTTTLGTAQVISDTVSWQGQLPPGGSVSILFRGAVTFPIPMGDQISWVTAQDGLRTWVDWAVLEIFGSLYFPWMAGRN